PYFTDYLKRTTDAAFLVELEPGPEGRLRPGPFLRASRFAHTRDMENAEWKFFVLDEGTGELRLPKGTVGHRWQEKKGEWNLRLEDSLTGEPIAPRLSLW